MAKKGAASGQPLTRRAGYLGPTYSNGKTDVLGDNWTGDPMNLQGPVAGPTSGETPKDPEGLSDGIS